jgi:large subunit ribosomal protein L4
MASLTVYDREGNEVDTIEVDPVRIAPYINKQLLHDAVVMYQANRRLGSAKTKSRGEVRGSRQKMYRQKGTGHARAGGRRSGVRRGGGHIHHRQPRDWSYRLPRKALQLATRMAIASKIRDREMTVVDRLDFDVPRTRAMVDLLRAVGCGDTSVLVATESHDTNVYKSARNIQKVSVSPVADLNALSVLSPRRMLLTRAALEAIQSRAAADATTAPSEEAPSEEAPSEEAE